MLSLRILQNVPKYYLGLGLAVHNIEDEHSELINLYVQSLNF